MKCFCIFKDKLKSKESAPELKKSRSKQQTSGARSKGSKPKSIREMYREKGQHLRVFSLSELREATCNFNRLLKVGEGGFGKVYKGSINPPDGQGDSIVVAIKKLNVNGSQGHKQWVAEVQFLGVVEHPNLVKLLGNSMPTISWRTRLNIILGAAQGIAYLHDGLDVKVIYRDFKTSNVLLDKDFNAKLSDFGLAREGPTGDKSHVSTAPIGTMGYTAPEYIETGHLSVKTDVWSFGVVLYEILTGRRAMERNRPSSEQKLLEWVKQYPADSSRFSVIIDSRLRNQHSLKAARRIAKLADSCLNKDARDRPTMSHVVEILKQVIEDSELETSKASG
nr:probable serine/threonine-protein kinase PBL19 [Ipomoea batatas]